MTTSPTPTHQYDPLGPSLRRGLDAPLRYSLWLRIVDRRCGIVDGILDARTERSAWSDAPEPAQAVTLWLARLQHTYLESAEADHHEVLAVQAAHRARRDHLESSLPKLREALAEAETARHTLEETPSEQVLASRGVAEQRDPESVVRSRRMAEHRGRVIAPAQARLDQARSTLEAAEREIHEIDAVLLAALDVGVARVTRTLEHFQRRADVYRRSYLRTWQRYSLAQERRLTAPSGLRMPAVLTLPAWAQDHLAHRRLPHVGGPPPFRPSTFVVDNPDH